MNNQRMMIVGGIILVVLLVVGGVFLAGRSKKSTQQTTSTEVSPTTAAIPTVDSSVKVALDPSADKREVTLSVKEAPKGTTTIDYELSYNTKAQGLQGVIGTITLDKGELSAEKKLTLGTCSSGTCVYHQVEGSIQLTLKFTGDYGQKLFEKEYEI